MVLNGWRGGDELEKEIETTTMALERGTSLGCTTESVIDCTFGQSHKHREAFRLYSTSHKSTGLNIPYTHSHTHLNTSSIPVHTTTTTTTTTTTLEAQSDEEAGQRDVEGVCCILYIACEYRARSRIRRGVVCVVVGSAH